jgi:NitT/TauT family transport system permease protein
VYAADKDKHVMVKSDEAMRRSGGLIDRGRSQAPQGLNGRLRSALYAQRYTLISVLAVLIFLIAWQLVGEFKLVNPVFFATPVQTYNRLVALAQSGALGTDLKTSGIEFGISYALSAVLGILLGLVVGWYKLFAALFRPFMVGLYASPRVALAPLVVIWFGLGLTAKVVQILMVAAIPIAINTEEGVRSVDPEYIVVARSYGANDLALFRRVILPASVPFIFVALRLAVSWTLIGLVVAELYASTSGVGYLLGNAGQQFDIGGVFAGLIVVSAAAIILMALVRAIGSRFESWRLA